MGLGVGGLRGLLKGGSLALVAGSCFFAVQVEAQPGTSDDPHVVPRTDLEVVVDGVIDEAAWDAALKLELRYEVTPGENSEPPVRTVVFLTFNESHFLVAFKAFDPDLYEDEVEALERDFFTQLLFSYKVNPQTVAFVGYSEGGQQTSDF